MTRTARIVVPEVAHHVIQRGNRRQDVFFSEADYKTYLTLLAELSANGDFSIHAYCLMRNHVHLIVTPHGPQGLRKIGEANRRYARYMNKKMEWNGYLWQGRFSSYPMDEHYAYEAVRYVEMNPVRAGICKHPAAFRWSSARQRIGKESESDYRVSPLPLQQFAVDDWERYWEESNERFEVVEEFINNEKKLKPMGYTLPTQVA